MILDELTEVVRSAVKREYGLDVQPELTYSDPQFGDFSSNIAFGLAKELKKAPKEIAQQLSQSIKDGTLASVEAAGSGFINITMSEGYWSSQLAKISPQYAENNSGNGEKVQVEFISANPTGPLTLGNARGGFWGDVLANVLAHSGYKVTREYYFNDAGTQIKKLVESVLAKNKSQREYQGEYIDELAKQFSTQTNISSDELGRQITDVILTTMIKPALIKMGITFDVWFNEHSLIESGQFAQALKELESRNLIKQGEGATWLKTSKLGEQRDRVLVKSSGDITYLGNDIAYHGDVAKRGFKTAIKVWGADHAAQIGSLKLAVNKLFPKLELKFIIVQWVRLISAGKEVKISKRAGTYVTIDELIDQVGSDVARFFMLLRAPDTHIDFDLDLAKEHSQKNPLYYLMYAYVRARAILQEATKKRLSPAQRIEGLSRTEQLLVRQLTKLPQLVADIAVDHQVHKLSFYGLELARLFHEFYEGKRIIDLEPQVAAQKLHLVSQFVVAMELYWKLLGITPKSKM